MTEYQSNSHRSKELQKVESAAPAERKVQKVISSGQAKTRVNNGRKLADIFISEDAANIKSYIFMDVLVPAIKKAISDIVTDGVSMLLYGGKGSSRSGDRISASTPKVSYRNYYDDGRDRRDGYAARVRFDYADISFPSRGSAEAALSQMIEILDRYPFVTVADLYEMAGLERECPHTANKYGWTKLNTADVVRVSDGYVIKLPKAMPID